MFEHRPITSVADAHMRAKKRLPKAVYVSLLAGTEQGITLRNNLAAFKRSDHAPASPVMCDRSAIWRRRCWDRSLPCR